MKRSAITPGSSGVQGSGLSEQTRAGLSRVARLKILLNTDAVFKPVFPEQGPVRSFFEDEAYVLGLQDQQPVMDWCVQATAPTTLSALITDWKPRELRLNGCQGPLMIEEALSAALALEVSLQSLTLADCVALDGGDRNDAERSEDSADDCDRCVDALGNLAWTCEDMVLERCSIFSSAELQDWLQKAAEACALQRLTLCEVSGLDSGVVQRLAELLLRSRIHSLHLGQLRRCDAPAAQALARAIAGSELSHLSLTQCDLGFVQVLLATLAEQQPGERPGKLSTLRIELSIVWREQPLAESQLEAVEEQCRALRQRFPGLQIQTDIRLLGTLDDVRITDSPRFLHRLGQYLWLFKRAEAVNEAGPIEPPDPVQVEELQAEERSAEPLQRVLPPNAALRVAFYLAEGKGSALDWVQGVDRHHRKLWTSAYQHEWLVQATAPNRVVQRIQRLLTQRNTAGLFAYAQRLRAQQRTPGAVALDQLAQACAKDEGMSECFMLAFNALRTIEQAAKEARTGDLQRYAALLREHGALPTAEQLEPVLELALEQPDLLQALWAFIGD